MKNLIPHIWLEFSILQCFILKIWILGRESNKGVMTVRKYSFLLANNSHKSIWELYVLEKYGNFALNIQNFEKTPQTFLNEYQKSNWFLKKKVICQNSSQTVLTPAIIWELFAKNSADRPNCHYSSVTFSSPDYLGSHFGLEIVFDEPYWQLKTVYSECSKNIFR